MTDTGPNLIAVIAMVDSADAAKAMASALDIEHVHEPCPQGVRSSMTAIC